MSDEWKPHYPYEPCDRGECEDNRAHIDRLVKQLAESCTRQEKFVVEIEDLRDWIGRARLLLKRDYDEYGGDTECGCDEYRHVKAGEKCWFCEVGDLLQSGAGLGVAP